MKALVIGHGLLPPFIDHEEMVRTFFLTKAPQGAVCHLAIVASSGSPSGNVITIQPNVAGCVQFAIDNGYHCIIRSYTSFWQYKLEWDVAYNNNISVYHAHGSNSNVYLSIPPRLFSAVGFGGGITHNIRSYGPGLEFFEATNEGYTEESWAAPTGAAKIETIRETLQCSKWEARYRARMKASENGVWNQNNGYGRISLQDALSFIGEIPTDPYLLPQKATDPSPEDDAVDIAINPTLSWTPGLGALSHKVYINDELLATQVETEYALTDLEYSTEYTWRVDEVNDEGTTTGDTWSFTTEEAPIPEDTYLTPSDVVTAVVSKINSHKNVIGVTAALEISEDKAAKAKPPYVGVYADTTEEALNASGDGTLFNVLIEIKLFCVCANKKTASEAFSQVWLIARKLVKLLHGSHAIGNYSIQLNPKKRPIEIVRKAADSSVVIVNMYYNDPDAYL